MATATAELIGSVPVKKMVACDAGKGIMTGICCAENGYILIGIAVKMNAGFFCGREIGQKIGVTVYGKQIVIAACIFMHFRKSRIA